MTENEGKGVACRYAIKGEPNVRMAYTATRNFDDHFLRAGRKRGEFAPLEEPVGHLELEAVRPFYSRQR